MLPFLEYLPLLLIMEGGYEAKHVIFFLIIKIMIVFSSSNQVEVRLNKGCNYHNRLSKFVVVQFGSIKRFQFFCKFLPFFGQ